MSRMRLKPPHLPAFSLVEVILALGITSFSVLVTFGLLSVANDSNGRSRRAAFAAQIAANEFERIRTLGAARFPASYNSTYFDSDLAPLGEQLGAAAIYQFDVAFVTDPLVSADVILNGAVRYPAQAIPANQTVVHFTTLMERPR